MSLANFKIFNASVRLTAIEVLAYQINLFNAATRGALVLKQAGNTTLGDYTDQSSWQMLGGLVRRRDAYATGAVTALELAQILETAVRVDAGTPPVQLDAHWLQRINASPAEAGAVVGKMVAEQRLADYVNTSLAALAAALGAQASLTHTPGAALSLAALNTGASKMGDKADQLACWVMPSKSLFDLYGAAIANSAGLFTFGTINVKADPFGKPIVVTDSLSLYLDTTTDLYYTLGLVPGAATIAENDDYLDNLQTSNGDESIRTTWQAQWSFNMALKGHTWDKTNGGKSPTTAALTTATNWDKTATSIKDLPGVIIKAQ